MVKTGEGGKCSITAERTGPVKAVSAVDATKRRSALNRSPLPSRGTTGDAGIRGTGESVKRGAAGVRTEA